jgi:peptide/nickel transport system substrate-binding protein
MRMDVAEAVQAQLAEIGVEVKLNFMDSNAYATYVQGGQHQMCVYGFYDSTGEAGHALMKFTPLAAHYGLTNHKNQSIIDTIYKGLHTIDQTERNKIYTEAQRKIMQTYTTMPLWSKEINAAAAKSISGFKLDKSYEVHDLKNVKIDVK